MAQTEDTPPLQSQGRDLTTGSIPLHLIIFALPMLAGSLLQTAYSFVNAIWVGQFLGKSALAAVTVSFPIIFVMIAVGAGLTMSTTILISQYYGAKNIPSLRWVVQTSVLLLGALSVILTGLGEVFSRPILRAMDTPPDVFGISADYMQVFLLSLPAGYGLFLVRSMLQGVGDSKTPLYFQSAGLLANAILDPLLIFGWLGFPKLGLTGVAWGTVIAQWGALVALLAYLHRGKNLVSPDWLHPRGDWKTAWDIVRIGIPSAAQQALVSIGMIFITGIVNHFGENSTAAFGAASRLDMIFFMPAMTFSMAVSALAGQNIGARAYHRVGEVYKWGMIMSGGVTLIGSTAVVCFPELLLRIFIHDEEVIRQGTEYLRIVGPTYIFFSAMFISNGIINGSGHTLVPTLVTLVSQWGFRVPLAYALSYHVLHSARGVWWSIAIGFFVSSIISQGYYFSGWWKREVIQTEPVAVPALQEEI